MAASVDSLKQQQFAKSAFGIPLKSSTFSRIQPPALHRISYLTGGLAELYEHIQNPNEEYKPNAEVPLLAKRYHFIRVLGKGCSAILIEAVDTFRPDSHHVAIKVLNEEYYALGYQESNNVERLNCADPQDFSGTVRLLNKFTFGNHFCLVFELLHPKPLHQYFKPISQGPKKLQLVRKVALRLLQVLGFLQQQNVIHADLKPENILCRSEELSAGVKVIDFGNAIHCVYDELSLYYDDFELQTLLYRAPEVVFGLPFGPEIDVWSVGCILAELYLGEPLFFAVTKDELLDKMVTSLGPLPIHIFQRGKFYSEYERYIGKPQSILETQSKLFCRLKGLKDYNFRSFILAFLQYNPSDRISVSDAFLHPFLAPEVAARYLMPSASKAFASVYHRIDIPENTYNLSPTICSEVAADRLASVDLLRRGTSLSQSDSLPAKKPKRAIAEVAPFALKPDVEGLCSSPAVVSVPVSVGVSSEKTTFEVAGGVLKQESLDTDGIVKESKVTIIPRDSNRKNTDIPKDSKKKNTDIQRDYKRKPANVPIYSNRTNTNLPRSSNRTTTKITKTSLPVPSSVAQSSEDQSSRQCKRLIPLKKNSVKKRKKIEFHPEMSAQDIITVNKKLKDPCGDGNKEVSDKKQDIQIEVEPPSPKRDSRKNPSVFQSILKGKLKIKKKQHNTYKTEIRSCKNRHKHSECQRSPQTATLEKHATITCQDSVATSSSLTSQSQIHVGASEDREDAKGKEQRSMNEQHHRTRISRFKHLEKMKRDAVQQHSHGTPELRDEPKEPPCNKSNQDGSPSIFIDNKKENADKRDIPSETHTPERCSREKGNLLLTPSSNPLEVSNDGLILLTPLSSTQNEESPKPQSENKFFKATPTRTPRIKHEMVRDRIPNKQKISQLFGAKKTEASQADKVNSNPETMIYSRSDANTTGQNQNQIHERRHDVEEIFCTPNKNDVDSKSGGNLLRTKEKHENNGASPGSVKNNVNSNITLTSMTPVSVSQESLRSGNCTVQSLSTKCSAYIQEDQVVDDKASQLEGRQSTDVKFTPRSSSRRSKSLAQERIKAKNFHQGEYWWKVSPREEKRREKEEVSLEDAEEGGDKAGRVSSSGKVPLAREEVGKQLADIKDEGELNDCTAHQERRISSKNLFRLTSSRMSPARSETSCVRVTEGMSTAHTHKTLTEDVYNFEFSPDLMEHTVVLSKKQKKPAGHTASFKSGRTSQKDFQKKLMKTQSHKHRKSTSSGTKVKKTRTLKRKISGSLIAEPQFTSRSDDNDFPDKSKHDSTIIPMRTLDSGKKSNEEEIKTIKGLEEKSHIKRRRIKQDCVINSQVGQYQRIPEDWESCFKSVARAPSPQDEAIMIESDNTLSKRQSGTEHEQSLSEDDSDDEWYPETSLKGQRSLQTPKTGSFDDDDEVMLL